MNYIIYVIRLTNIKKNTNQNQIKNRLKQAKKKKKKNSNSIKYDSNFINYNFHKLILIHLLLLLDISCCYQLN